MPDIALIPAICSVLEITSDELLGIDLEKKAEEIDKICEEAEKYSSRGYMKEAQKMLEDGLKRYPDSFKIMSSIMYVDHILSYEDEPEERDSARSRAIELSERILEKCTDNKIREGAVQTLCFIYKELGNTERAKELLGMMGSLITSRDVLKTFVYSGSEALTASQKLILLLMDEMTRQMRSNYELDSKEFRYSTSEEKALVYNKVISMYHILFEDGNFGFYHTDLCRAENSLARCYAENNDAENTLTHLHMAAYHAIEFLKYAEVENFVYTSLVLRGYVANGKAFMTTGRENDALEMRKWLSDARYDFVRDTEEFGSILSELDEYAGEWEKKE